MWSDRLAAMIGDVATVVWGQGRLSQTVLPANLVVVLLWSKELRSSLLRLGLLTTEG